ncbi:MAG: hypothetical protein AABW72_03520 [archaeon]|mgnify:CR=1 FL=1
MKKLLGILFAMILVMGLVSAFTPMDKKVTVKIPSHYYVKLPTVGSKVTLKSGMEILFNQVDLSCGEIGKIVPQIKFKKLGAAQYSNNAHTLPPEKKLYLHGGYSGSNGNYTWIKAHSFTVPTKNNLVGCDSEYSVALGWGYVNKYGFEQCVYDPICYDNNPINAQNYTMIKVANPKKAYLILEIEEVY